MKCDWKSYVLTGEQMDSRLGLHQFYRFLSERMFLDFDYSIVLPINAIEYISLWILTAILTKPKG